MTSFVKGLTANIFTFAAACALEGVPWAGAMAPVGEQPSTLEFHLVDEAPQSDKTPPDDKLYQLSDGSAILLKGDVVAGGDEVAEAVAMTTPEGPAVYIRLDARGAASMLMTTRRNLGQRLAVVYNGRVISVAVIRGVFGPRFEVITAEARAIATQFGGAAGHRNH
jgi:preprotein translocase subunit SecD